MEDREESFDEAEDADPLDLAKVNAEAAEAVAGALVDHVRDQRKPKAPKKRTPPPPFVRGVLLIQAFFRRRAFLKSFPAPPGGEIDEEIMELAPPRPGMAVALAFCRRLKNTGWMSIEREATLVAGMVDAQAGKITMRDVSAVVQYYEDKVEPGHLSLQVLQEALDRMVTIAQEALQEMTETMIEPAQVVAAMEETIVKFQVPQEREDRVVDQTRLRLKRLCVQAEDRIRKLLAEASSTPMIDAVSARLDKEFGPLQSVVTEEIKVARIRRVQFLEMELETRWSRPFAGPLPPHSRAARRYEIELGKDNPKVIDFVREEKRHSSALEADLEVELSKLQSKIRDLTRKRLESRARSMIEDYDERLAAAAAEVQEVIDQAIVNIGPDNQKVTKRALELLAPDAHAAVFALQAERSAEALRAEIELADPSPEAGDRRRGCAMALEAILRALSKAHPLQEILRGEFYDAFAEIEVDQAPSDPPPLPGPSGPGPTSSMATPEQGIRQRDLPEPAREPAPEASLSREEDPFHVEPTPEELARALLDAAPQEQDDYAQQEKMSKDEEDAWGAPVGFQNLISASEEVVAKVMQPNGGLSIDDDPTPKEIRKIEPDPGALMMMESFTSQDPAARPKSVQKAAMKDVTAVLTLEDLTMDVVKMHTEEVFKIKFARAIADSIGVPRHRIKVNGFATGSVKVLLSLLEPTGDEPEDDTGRAKMSADRILQELQNQVYDPNSKLRLGEVGPFVASANLERSVAPGAKLDTSSMSTTYMAESLHGEAFEIPGQPGQPKKAWATPNSTGVLGASQTGGLGGSPEVAATDKLVKKAAESVGTRWGASRLEPGSLASQSHFRSTNPHETEDGTGAAWAIPYEKKPMYTFYEGDKQEAAQESVVKLPASKKKFTQHASFHLTRHPATGTDVLKGKIPPAGGVHVFSADTWLDKEHLGMKDPTLRPGDVDLKETFKKKEEEKEAEEPASPTSPVSDEDSPSGKKGKKKKPKKEESEPEPEEGAIDAADSQVIGDGEVVVETKGGKGKKGGKKQKSEDEMGKTMDSLASEDDGEIDSPKTPGKKKAQDKKKALKIVEEGADADDELATPLRKKAEKSPKRDRTRSPKSPGSRRPGSGDSKDGSKLDIDGMGGTMEKTVICWSGMHGGISGTGLRPRWEGNSRLPALVGKPLADDLKTPAYVRSAYRHGTVTIGPPYKFKDHMDEKVPAWTLAATMDMHIDRNDWSRSYHKVMKDRTAAKLGPQDSIRNLARSVSLPKVAGRPKPKKRPAAVQAPAPERPGQSKEAWPETSQSESELHAQGSVSDSGLERPGTSDGSPSSRKKDKKEKKEKKEKSKDAAKTDPGAFKQVSQVSEVSSPTDSQVASTTEAPLDKTKPAPKKGGKGSKAKKDAEESQQSQPEASQEEATKKDIKKGKDSKDKNKKKDGKDESKEDPKPSDKKKAKKDKDGKDKDKEDKKAAQSSGAEDKKADKKDKSEDKEKKDKKDKKEKKEKDSQYPPEVALTDFKAVQIGQTLQILQDPARVKEACSKAGLAEDGDTNRVAACGKKVKVLSTDNGIICCEVLDVGQVFFAVESLREAEKDVYLSKPSVATWYQPIILDPEVEAAKEERKAVTSFMAKFYKRTVPPETTQVDKKATDKERTAGVEVYVSVLRAVAAGGLREASLERWQALQEAKQIKGAEEAIARALMEPAKDGEAKLDHDTCIAAATAAAYLKKKDAVKNLPIIPLKAKAVGDPQPQRRTHITNSSATKQQVQNYAMSMTASIFRKAGSKKTNSLSPPPARKAEEKGLSSSASGPIQMENQQGTQRPSSRERPIQGAATTGNWRKVKHALPADEGDDGF